MDALKRARARFRAQVTAPIEGLPPNTIRVVCAWCGKHIEDVSAQGAESGLSHGICEDCYRKMTGKSVRTAATAPVGMCFEYVFQYARQHPDEDFIAVHATVHDPWDGHPYAHAWIETQGKCLDWQSMEAGLGKYPRQGWPKEEFYAAYRPENIQWYYGEEILKNSIRFRHKGPWDLRGSLRRALLTLQAKPFIADPEGRFPGLVFSLEHRGGQPDAYQSSAMDRTSLRPIGHVYASQSIAGYYEVQSADVDGDFQGMGIGQSLYLILAEAVPTGLMPNITASVSTDAENVWRSLPQYGMVVEFDLDPEDIQNIGPRSWKSMEQRGLNVVLLDPEPPPGFSSWREMIEETGGTWSA